jgi:uncharacterized protein YjbI with pentapeptide repeats
MKYEIKHRITGAVLFSMECESIKLCVEAAVRAGCDLSGANLSDADLSGATLFGCDLSDANLSDANLSDANLSDANLSDANLSDANLSRADLSDANLSDAYLSDATLSGATLFGCDLSRADLSGADLSGVKQAAQLGQPDGWHAWTYITPENKQRVRVGCRDYTIAEGRDYWKGKDNRREVLAALDYAEAIGKLRQWGQ